MLAEVRRRLMVCIVRFHEKPKLRDPVLIEGLPRIGLVANIVALHLIRQLGARLFGEVYCSSFQNVAIPTEEGSLKFPMSQLYYHKGTVGERDLIILYGNTQALTTRGQYELCSRILDVAQEMGCRYVITLGGYRPGREVKEPKLYYAASDIEVAEEVRSLGAEALRGQIFGVAGLLIGLGKLLGMRGFCLLAETPGTRPDVDAAREVLKGISRVLGLRVSLDGVEEAVKALDVAKPFKWMFQPERRTGRERGTEPEWFI